MSPPDKETDLSLSTRIADTERRIVRKMDALAKHVAHTELFDESSRRETEQLKTALEERLTEFDSLSSRIRDTTVSLRQIADQDQKQRIAQLDLEIATLDNVLEHVASLIEIQDLVEATEACMGDRTTALAYLDRIETLCRKLDSWSDGRLLITKSIGQYLVNKRYTLEMEQRESLKKPKKESELVVETEPDDHQFGGGDAQEDGTNALLGKIREILRKPLEPTEELHSEDFGGPGDVSGCRVSFWARPLVIELLDSSEPSILIGLYTSFYKESVTSLSDKEIAIVYSNSMFIAHKLLLHCLLYPGKRTTLNATIGLRRFADVVFHQRLRKLQFNSATRRRSGLTLDDTNVKGYPVFLQRYSSEIREILPHNIAERIVRLLVEDYLATLISTVLKKEDIESNEADRWVLVLTEVLTGVKQVAGDTRVELLDKAEEMRNILSYGLKEFASHWRNPESRLRTHYQAEEVSHLVKAIFQNSPMRSSILMHIK